MARLRAQRPTVSAGTPCPCGTGEPYGRCCGRFHAGQGPPPTALLLMRSRYAAFVVLDAAYLLRTWSSGHRPPSLTFDRAREWTGLEILGYTAGTAFHTEGTVEFRARYVHAGRPGELRENSRFIREDGRWVYERALTGSGG